MSAGLEIRGNSLRIWIKDGENRYRETLGWKNTAENLERAEILVNIIKGELKLGSFNLSHHFPNSKYIKKNKLMYYISLWEVQTKTEVAPSTFDAYLSQVKNHIRMQWANKHPQEVNTNSIKIWINHLKTKLHSKTVREIVTRLAQIHTLWRHEHKIAYDPFSQINVMQLDAPEPDPFTKYEIKTILETDSVRDIRNLLPCIFWSGLSISEQIPLAWEDIDLEKGIIHIKRSYVRGIYRVTKNRRRNRKIQLLQPVIDSLKEQYKRTGHLGTQTINVLQRDNYSFKQSAVRFVWINSETLKHFEYYEIRYRWNKHLKKAKVRGRGINQGRHTFASQLLSSGQVPPEWIADQLGHADTNMIYKHYGKLIAEDAPDYTSRINHYITT